MPDLAGWRKERLPEIPESHKFTVIPDWICEIFSPTTGTFNREIKKPLYANYGVRYSWLIHPLEKTLEAYKLAQSEWELQAVLSAKDRFALEPFETVEFNVSEIME